MSAFGVQVRSALALPELLSTIAVANPIKALVILVFMIRVSFIVLFIGLQYHETNLASGAQTMRLGWAGPVSNVLGGMTLTGQIHCFVLRLS